MSGPKRADVEAQLNIARRSQRTCAGLISAAQDAAIAGIIRDADSILRDADGIAGQLRDATGGFTPDMRRIAPDGIGGIDAAASAGASIISSVRDDLNQARTAVDQARRQEDAARNTFTNAEREYERAMAALRDKSGDHYMHEEMQWAREATRIYDQAARELNSAAQTRGQAERAASSALQRGREARGNLDAALRQVATVRNEAQSLLRAEEEARRIAEEKRRIATVAVEKARSAFARVDDLPHVKFRPGGMDACRKSLDAVIGNLNSGRFDEAKNGSEQLVTALGTFEREVMAAQQEFARKKAAAESQIEILTAALAGIDEALILEWSTSPDACTAARDAISGARQSVDKEQFESAAERANAARQNLRTALQSAAEGKSAHERRQHIGNAIMEVLEELNFDVSYEIGDRDNPLRIAGQTSDVAGKGDFDIAIPLSGEVDFHVESPQGDVSCVGAVQELQKRLAERGVKWNTTDWGHAEGASVTNQIKKQVRETVQQGIKVHSKG